MCTHLARFFALASIMLLAVSHVAANTVFVQVGGVTTSGDPYYGYTNNPVLMFQPADITINVGDTVTFQSLGGAPHNVHADDNSFRCAAGCDGQGGNGTPSTEDWTSSVTFNKAGVVTFHCDTHQSYGMTGKITVQASTQTSTIDLGGYLSGNWYNNQQGGHGFQLELTNKNNDMIAIWFVYAPDGTAQNWIYAEGAFDPTKNTVTLPAEILTGARFPPNFNAADVRQQGGGQWGTITFTFTDCFNGTASWHSDMAGYNNANDTPLAIQRLTQIAGTTCPQ